MKTLANNVQANASRQHKLRQWQASFCIALLAGCIALPAAADPQNFKFTEVKHNSDLAFTQLLGINNFGQIAGYYGDGTIVPNNGFIYSLQGRFLSENFPDAVQTQVIAINNLYDTAGFYVDAGGTTHGFFKKNHLSSSFQTIDAPNTAFNQILGLNDLGQMAGYSSTDPAGATLQKAFIRQADGSFVYVPLPAVTSYNVPIANSQATGINDAQIACGFYVDIQGNSYGFLWDSNTNSLKKLRYPNANFTQALGINNAGQVVGVYSKDGGKSTHGFIYKQGNYQRVDEPKSTGHATLINGINDKGAIVGFFSDHDNNTVGFIGAPTMPLW